MFEGFRVTELEFVWRPKNLTQVAGALELPSFGIRFSRTLYNDNNLPTSYQLHLNAKHMEFLPQSTSELQGFRLQLPDIPSTNNAYFPGLGNYFDMWNFTSNSASYGGAYFICQSQTAVNTGATVVVGYLDVVYHITFCNWWS